MIAANKSGIVRLAYSVDTASLCIGNDRASLNILAKQELQPIVAKESDPPEPQELPMQRHAVSIGILLKCLKPGSERTTTSRLTIARVVVQSRNAQIAASIAVRCGRDCSRR